MKIKKKNIIVLLFFLLCLSSCVFKEDKSLYDYRNEYLGDASATISILNQLNFDENLNYDHIELDYTNDINTLEVFFTNPSQELSSDVKQNLFNNSCFLFGLIKNLDAVKFYINGSQKYLASKNFIEDQQIFNKKFIEYFESEEFFYELENKINSLNTTAFMEGDVTND